MAEENEYFQRGRRAAPSPPDATPVEVPAPDGQIPPDAVPLTIVPPLASADEVEAAELRRLGSDLARALEEGGYHPVVLFGTNFSGKTSLLLSLFATLMSEPELEAGLVLCDPILGRASSVGKRLHKEARHTFNVKTQAFLEGENIARTNINLPFFIPVEFRPAGKPVVRFAFLESNGEWYRPNRDRENPIADREELFPELRNEIEDFIASYQGGISFLYLTPFTQGVSYGDTDTNIDADEVMSASLAIANVLTIYDRIRLNHRARDRHLMLVTKWDVRSLREPDRAEAVAEDRDALNSFTKARYGRALTAFQGLAVDQSQRQLSAYCAGIINKKGLLQLRAEDELKTVVTSYPIRLWKWLYASALTATDQSVESPFPEPPEPPFLQGLWNRLLEFVSGR